MIEIMVTTTQSLNKLSYRWRSRTEALECLFSQFTHKDRVLITIDPDPDAIASAMALKRLLWHKVQNTVIGCIRPVRRLNNQTLVRLLRLPIRLIESKDLKEYSKYVLVDGQPQHNAFFSDISYSAIIDHHPLMSAIEAPFVDVRPDYGATATIFTEYLRTAKIKPSQSLATALIYGIKTDTRSMERHTLLEDVKAFHFLFSLVNHSVLRKIEISDLALKDLRHFTQAISAKHVVRDRIFSFIGKVASADILVILAEFFLKVHDISWSIVSGLVGDDLIVVVRNDGYRKDAGKLVARAFGHLGSAGGHRAMARAEIPMKNLGPILGKTNTRALEIFVRRRLSGSV
ncbi:MAG TPA: phosphoethanolamine methyltransferase [Syntrophobacteraceae bacterium]|nr:phosphoethanolamine methyltransferase [Syntrophobacteraceae bacterium]